MSFLLVIQAAMLRRILWPAWRWSKVPPRATTGRKGEVTEVEIMGDSGREDLGDTEMGDVGCSFGSRSAEGKKDWRTEDMDRGRGTAMESRYG